MKLKYENTTLEVNFWAIVWRTLVFIPCIIYLICVEFPLILISALFNYISLVAIFRDYSEDNSFIQMFVDYGDTIDGIINWYSKNTIQKISKK